MLNSLPSVVCLLFSNFRGGAALLLIVSFAISRAEAVTISKAPQPQHRIPYPKLGKTSVRYHITLATGTPVRVRFRINRVADTKTGKVYSTNPTSVEIYPGRPHQETGYHFWEEDSPAVEILDEEPLDRAQNTARQKAQPTPENDLRVPEGGNKWRNATEAERKLSEKRRRMGLPPYPTSDETSQNRVPRDCTDIQGDWKNSWSDSARGTRIFGRKSVEISPSGTIRHHEVLEGYNQPGMMFVPGGMGTGNWRRQVISQYKAKPLGNNRYAVTRDWIKHIGDSRFVVEDPKGSPNFTLVLEGKPPDIRLVVESNRKIVFTKN